VTGQHAIESFACLLGGHLNGCRRG
jgi:hypothetical protein